MDSSAATVKLRTERAQDDGEYISHMEDWKEFFKKKAQAISLNSHSPATEGQLLRSYQLYPGEDKIIMDEG